ncbi:RIP metalloprotease RseP [Candidatus Atribacteria bacterium HGW-Atribacteria-1]|nr:MAG: RIP metalloprotease RseP [Candidatus Atribacteria bacterium HGW-Atribacteria-1]
MLTIIAFIFVFSILIFFHEFGHFIAAKASGVGVYKFAFGFGPRILGFTINQTEYLICLIPLGGYVKMAGEMGQEDVKETSEEVSEEQRFDKKTLGIRALIVALGPFMNIATAVVIFSLIFFTNGIPIVTNYISTVVENGPAERAGIFSGDKIIAINSIEMEDPNRIANIINKSSGEELQITLDRGGENIDVFVIPEYDDNYKKGLIGITFEISVEKINIFSAFSKGLIATINIIKLIFTNTVEMITGKVPVEIAGPLGIAQMTGEAAKLGFLNLLYFTAILSIFIGLFNLLPIPILDGGHLLILAIEKLRGKPLEPEKINFMYLIGISLMIIIFIIATYKDILRVFVK